jgi:hypothetical protein
MQTKEYQPLVADGERSIWAGACFTTQHSVIGSQNSDSFTQPRVAQRRWR